MLLSERPLSSIDYIIVSFQADQSLSQSFTGLCCALLLSSPVFFPDQTPTLYGHHLGSYCACLIVARPPRVPSRLLGHAPSRWVSPSPPRNSGTRVPAVPCRDPFSLRMGQRAVNLLGWAMLLSPGVSEAVASNLIELSQFCSLLFY